MTKFTTIAAITIGASLLATSALAQQPAYDLVITGGRVMDPETMFDSIANVGIKDGRIAAITTDEIEGADTIDASGLVVAPGFIDTHFHAVDPFATKMSLRDGVTTGMDLELGALHVGDWYDKKQKDGWQVNYGTTAGLNLARMAVHDPEVPLDEPVDFSNAPSYLDKALEDGVPGWSVTRSNIDQMNAVMKILDEDLHLFRIEASFVLNAIAFKKDRHLSLIGDQVLWKEIRKSGLKVGRVSTPLVNYVTNYGWHYWRHNETPPPGAKRVVFDLGDGRPYQCHEKDIEKRPDGTEYCPPERLMGPDGSRPHARRSS